MSNMRLAVLHRRLARATAEMSAKVAALHEAIAQELDPRPVTNDNGRPTFQPDPDRPVAPDVQRRARRALSAFKR